MSAAAADETFGSTNSIGPRPFSPEENFINDTGRESLHYFVQKNLYQSQKLLSFAIDGQFPVWKIGPPPKGGSGNPNDGLPGDLWGWRTEGSNPGYYDEDSLSLGPAVILTILSFLVVCLAYRCYHQRTRPRRKRPPRLRRLMAALNAGRVPAV